MLQDHERFPVGPDGRADPEQRRQAALDVAYRYLGFRDRTEAEVRRKLEVERTEPADIDATLEELARQGYVDDARFAQRYAEDRRALDGWGPDRIERRLRQSGVDPELIAAALSSRELADELAAAVEVLRRRLRAVPETERERERALGLLVRRGYDLELAYDAIRAHAREAAAG